MIKNNPITVPMNFNQNPVLKSKNTATNKSVTEENPQDTFVKRNKKKIKLAGGISILLLSALFYYRHKRNEQLDLQIQKDLDAKREKIKKNIEELAKQLELETQKYRQGLIDDITKTAGIEDSCFSWEELDKKYAEKRKKDAQKFKENLEKQKKEFDSIFDRFKQQGEESKKRQEDYSKWWDEFKAKWEKTQAEQQKEWERVWANWQKTQEEFKNDYNSFEESFKTKYKQNKSQSKNNNNSKKTNNSNNARYENVYDKEDYSGFNNDEIADIKSTFSSETNLISHIFSKKNILAKYIEATEDDIIKLLNKDKSTYRRLSIKWHPDKIHLESKEGRFKLINYIYNY